MALMQVATRIDESQGALFKDITHRLGITPADALRMFICAFNEHKGFPYQIRLSDTHDTEAHFGQSDIEALVRGNDSEKVRSAIAKAASEFPSIRKAFLFGSFARGDHHASSDVDVRIEHDAETFSLYELARFAKIIEQETGRSVDVVSANTIKNEKLAEAIEREKVLVYAREEQ
ncbi:MAG: nucleotidyltransferase domain-containing protein [Eggerthellaceae bacterium]|nr:nucleotidyltransferase domain-containing protein [Eggerthellaceae bacterium]